jgi:hypothetical protein
MGALISVGTVHKHVRSVGSVIDAVCKKNPAPLAWDHVLQKVRWRAETYPGAIPPAISTQFSVLRQNRTEAKNA